MNCRLNDSGSAAKGCIYRQLNMTPLFYFKTVNISSYMCKIIMRILIFSFSLLLSGLCSQNALANIMTENISDTVPYGLTAKEWARVESIWKHYNKPVIIQFTNAGSARGQLLQFRDSILYYWDDPDGFYNPILADSLIKTVMINEIRSIIPDYRLSGRFETNGLFLGTLTGGVLGTCVVLVSAGWASFIIAVPPAALGTLAGWLVENNKKKKCELLSVSSPEILLYGYFPANDFIVFPESPEFAAHPIMPGQITMPPDNSGSGFDALVQSSPLAQRIFRPAKSNLTIYYGMNRPCFFKAGWPAVAGATLTAPVAGRFSAGIGYRYYETLPLYKSVAEPGPGINDESLVRKNSVKLTGSFTPKKTDIFLSNRFEFAFGAGISVNEINLSRKKVAFSDENQVEVVYDLGQKHLKPGLEQSFITRVTTTEIIVENPFTSEQYTIEPEIINASTLGYLLGVSFHF